MTSTDIFSLQMFKLGIDIEPITGLYSNENNNYTYQTGDIIEIIRVLISLIFYKSKRV